jgi:hypothetical protein
MTDLELKQQFQKVRYNCDLLKQFKEEFNDYTLPDPHHLAIKTGLLDKIDVPYKYRRRAELIPSLKTKEFKIEALEELDRSLLDLPNSEGNMNSNESKIVLPVIKNIQGKSIMSAQPFGQATQVTEGVGSYMSIQNRTAGDGKSSINLKINIQEH